MNVTVNVKKGQKPTQEQIQEIRNAANLDPVFDDESPKLSYEQMKRYQKAALQKKNKIPVTIELSDADYEAAKSFGASYRSVHSDILSIAIKDPNLVNRVRIR
ncbi:MAG: hypothetical protein J6T79_01910 [Verrucomicrobia bacterium]|nr:hypothetical protein [Verrucomicrobiota bacterium]